jgi:hypothetical protein
LSPGEKQSGSDALPGDSERVGHCRPPVAARFRPGTSGNPCGRPRRARTLGAVVAALLRESVSVEVKKGQVRRITKLEAAVRRIVDGAVNGEPRETRLLVALIKANEGAPAPAPDPKRREKADVIIMAELKRRFGQVSPSGAP